MNLAKYKDIKEIQLEKLGFDIKKVDFSTFRKNFTSALTKETMKEEARKIMAADAEKNKAKQEEIAKKLSDEITHMRRERFASQPQAKTFMAGEVADIMKKKGNVTLNQIGSLVLEDGQIQKTSINLMNDTLKK